MYEEKPKGKGAKIIAVFFTIIGLLAMASGFFWNDILAFVNPPAEEPINEPEPEVIEPQESATFSLDFTACSLSTTEDNILTNTTHTFYTENSLLKGVKTTVEVSAMDDDSASQLELIKDDYRWFKDLDGFDGIDGTFDIIDNKMTATQKLDLAFIDFADLNVAFSTEEVSKLEYKLDQNIEEIINNKKELGFACIS